MSRSELSDAQLDALLGQLPGPPAPIDGLAERIVARAATTAQRPLNRSVVTPRRHIRRRPFVWTAFIAANALAAAAAASSWDGQRFDFHRLTDLPHRVAVAIHLPHHHEQVPVRARHPHPAPSVRPVSPAVPVANSSKPRIASLSIPATASLGPRTQIAPVRVRVHVTPVGRHPIRPRPHSAINNIALSHRSAPAPEFRRPDRQDQPAMSRMAQSPRRSVPELGADRPIVQQDQARRPDFGDNRRFGRAAPDNWDQMAPVRNNGPHFARIGGLRRGPNWGRFFRRPQRGQKNRFARRF